MKWYVSVLDTNFRIILRIRPGDYKFGDKGLMVILTNYPRKRITARLLERISRERRLIHSRYTSGMKEILKLGYKIELPMPPNLTD